MSRISVGRLATRRVYYFISYVITFSVSRNTIFYFRSEINKINAISDSMRARYRLNRYANPQPIESYALSSTLLHNTYIIIL